VTIDLEDPFALPSESRVTDRDSILSRGRYMLPNRDGTKKARGFMRVSNLVSAYSDQFGLRMWELGEVLQGVAMNPELYATLLAARLDRMDRPTRKAWVEQFVEHAKDSSGGNYGSKYGQQRHAAVEVHHAGLPQPHADAGTRRHLHLYDAALQRHKLRALPGMQERRVLIEELQAVGTLDNILTDLATGIHHVGDLKTQRRFWTWLEIKAQQACYAHGDAMWDEVTGTWVEMPPVSRDTAFILWMQRHPDDPEEAATWEPHVDIYEVDVREGWETAQRAYGIVRDRAKAKSVNPGAWLRPAPEPTLQERYAARFAAVETLRDGQALVLECKAEGVWDALMREQAQRAYDRIAIKP
jgi:hypothetical protein